MQILDDVESRGSVTATEFADLQAIAANLENGITTSDYVASIFYQLVDGSAANDYFTAGNTSHSGRIISLGNLAAGTTATQLNELIQKWFYGGDMPDPTIPADDTSTNQPIYPTYTAFNDALFGTAGTPQISDVAQGSVGDCELCSGMIETLLNHPNLIEQMFVSDGNGLYGVRFYVNGTETWVTVNDDLPTYDGSLVFNNAYVANPANGLWADLLEKAYAELSATGNIGHPAVNSYANIEADTAIDVLTDLTDASLVEYFYSSDTYWNSYKAIIINALAQHDDVILETGNNIKGTFDSSGNEQLVSNHAYAVISYDSATGDFLVRNPWGVESGTQNYDTQFEVSMSVIASNAVQGDFAVDNSAAPNVVSTGSQLLATLTNQVYTSFQQDEATFGANTTVSLAPLFQIQDDAGLAITQYMVQALGGTINLNGAANVATAAQQAAGEIVVSAADLSKLTLTTGAVGSTVEVYLSGNDGSGFSLPVEQSWTVDSQGITVLPDANPLVAPSETISLASLFQLAGATGGSLFYTIKMDAGLGTFNLNGATDLSSAGGSTEIEVSAADLAKVTYTLPATPGVAVIDIGAASSSASSDLTQVAIDVGSSVATALQEFKSGTIQYQLGVADSAANIFGNLDALEAMMPNFNLLGVLVTDPTQQTETISVGQFISDLGVLSILSGNYALDISGATVAQAESLLGNSANHINAVQIIDSAADIFAGLSALETLATAGQIASLSVTDGNDPAESLTTAQVSADAAVLSDISGAYSLSVSGSAAGVVADLTTLQSLAAHGDLGSITLTDGGTPALSISAQQLTADATALNDISGSFTVTVAAGTSAVNITGLSGHPTTVAFSGDAGQYAIGTANGAVTVSSGGVTDTLANVAAIQFADVTEIVAAPPGPAGAVTTGNITELYAAVLAREPDLSGLTYYQNYLAANPNTALQQFAVWFLSSTEYTSNTAHDYAQSTAGDMQFIEDSYQNLLHRTPSSSEVSYYETNVLAPAVANFTPGTAAYASAQLQAHALMLVYFSASTEFLSDVQVTATNPASAQHWLILT